MEGEEPLYPCSLNFSTSSEEARSDGSAPASPSTASTLSHRLLLPCPLRSLDEKAK